MPIGWLTFYLDVIGSSCCHFLDHTFIMLVDSINLVYCETLVFDCFNNFEVTKDLLKN